jgi:radical SAM protein (TIGR01212 family)
MDNYLWGGNRPFNAYSSYMKKTYGQRLQKLSIDAGFTCPNRDGKVGKGGCTFCLNAAFNPSYCQKYDSITKQLDEGILFHKWRYKNVSSYLAYFQSYSNTYAPIEELQKKYEEALSHKDVVGLVIATRPDCVDNEKLDYLQKLSENHIIIMEYGIESCYDKTLSYVNRGHTFSTTVKAIEETSKRGIKVGGHLIFGFPTESLDDMRKEASIVSSLALDTIKFHQLQILQNTPMMKEYEENPQKFHLFSFQDYKDFIISFLETLNPRFVIERFVSEVPPRYNVISTFGNIRNETIVEEIEKQMINTGSYQGKYYKQ